MRKNGSREISFSQYRTTDLFLFAVIVAVAELFAFAATVWFPEEAIFSFSFMLPLALTVMMRWGWPSVFYAVGSGLIYCALHSCSWQYFLAWSVGNASIIVVLAYLIPIGKERVAKSWLLSLGMVLIAWAAMVLVRSAVFAAATAVALVYTLGLRPIEAEPRSYTLPAAAEKSFQASFRGNLLTIPLPRANILL